MSADNAGAAPRRARTTLLRLVVAGLVLAVASGAVWLALQNLGTDKILNWAEGLRQRAGANMLPAVIAFGALVFAAATLAVPVGALITAVGGFLFGGAVAGSVAVVCGTCGAACLLGVVHRLGGAPLARGHSRRVDRIAAAFRAEAASYMLFLRLTPTPFFLVTIAAGMARVNTATFVWTTAVGMLPATFAHAFAGAALEATAAAQTQLHQVCLTARAAHCTRVNPLVLLADPAMMITLATLGLLAVAPVVLRRLFFRRSARSTVLRAP